MPAIGARVVEGRRERESKSLLLLEDHITGVNLSLKEVERNEMSVVLQVESSSRKRKTRLRLANLCCELEVKLVKKRLLPMEGVEDVKVNVIGRMAIVTHDDRLDGGDLATELNKAHLGATVASASGASETIDDESFWDKEWLASIVVVLMYLVGVIGTSVTSNESYEVILIAAASLGAVPIAIQAFVKLLTGHVDVNCLMLLAFVGAMAVGEYVEAGGVVAAFIVANRIQHTCLDKVRLSLRDAAARSTDGLATDQATLVHYHDVVGKKKKRKEETLVALSEVKPGDVVAVRPGERIPVDGIVAAGDAAVDVSALTGESVPVAVKTGCHVMAGALVANGFLEVETEKAAEESSTARLRNLVADAQASASPTQLLVDDVASYFAPVAIVTAFLVFLIPVLFFGGSLREWLMNAAVLLVVACPCALVLAAPAPAASAFAAAAERKAIIKSADALEALATVDLVALDKTGTLTQGHCRVIGVRALGKEDYDVDENDHRIIKTAHVCVDCHVVAVPVEGAHCGGCRPCPDCQVVAVPAELARCDVCQEQRRQGESSHVCPECNVVAVPEEASRCPSCEAARRFEETGNDDEPSEEEEEEEEEDRVKDALRLAASLETRSTHPLATAIVGRVLKCVTAYDDGTDEKLSESVKKFKVVPGGGVTGYVDDQFVAIGNANFCGMSASRVAEFEAIHPGATHIFVAIDDEPRLALAITDPVRPEAVDALNALLPYDIAMLTGDQPGPAAFVAAQLPNLLEVQASLKPDDKLKWVHEKQQGGRHVLMVGDGINDAPALKLATVGAAMSASGTVMALEAADLAILSDDLRRLPDAIRLAHFTRSIILENVLVALFIKVAIVLIVVLGYGTLWMAILADVLALVLVLGNSLRPLSFFPQTALPVDHDLPEGNDGSDSKYGSISSNTPLLRCFGDDVSSSR